jgi:hypothetical protein
MFSRLSSPTGPIAVSTLAGIALAVTGCGSSGSSGMGASAGSKSGTTASTTGTTTTLSASGSSAPPAPRALVEDASGEVKTLLAVAKPGTTISSQGTVPGWAPANGSAIPADPSHISGFGFVADKSKGIQYLSFAVKDTSGRCAGGDLLANAAGTRTTGGKAIAVPAKTPCTGEEVAKLAGHG